MHLLRIVIIFVAVVGGRPVITQAQPPAAAATKQPPLGATNSSELSVVVSSGNAESTSAGFRNVYVYRWPVAELGWETGWLRATSRDGSRYAVQSGSGFDVVDPETALDSHRLFSKLRYQRQFYRRMDWFSNFDAVRDEPANVNRQFVVAGGLGTTWRNSDRLTFRTGYGISYTDEDLVVEGANRFAGYRLQYRLKSALTATTTVESELTGDGSFETSDDIRTDWLNGLGVAVNSRVALKASVRLLFRNRPALETLPLRTPAGVVISSVDVAKEKVDTNFTTSLVITF